MVDNFFDPIQKLRRIQHFKLNLLQIVWFLLTLMQGLYNYSSNWTELMHTIKRIFWRSFTI